MLGTMDKRLCGSVERAIELFNSKNNTDNVYYLELPFQDEADGLSINWHPTVKTHRKTAEIVEKKIIEILKK